MKYDQHFMIDKLAAGRIADYLDIKKKDNVIEIGPGNGALTEFLIAKTKNLEVIEIDDELCKELKKRFADVSVVNKNVLNLRKLEAEKIIGNLAYSICEPFINLLVKSSFKLCVITVPVGFMSDGLLKKLMNIFFTIKTLEIIDKESFNPKPKVKSKVIMIKPRKLRMKGQLVKEVYLQSDKTLNNALKEAYCKIYGSTKKEALDNIPELRFIDKRVYTLSSEEWKLLLESLNVRQ